MAGMAATTVVKEAVRGCFQVIGPHISFIREYKININNLKVELKKLEDAESTVQQKIRTAENNAEDILPHVLGWRKRCDELLVQVNDFLNNEMSFHMSCLCCNGPNLKSRYSASRKAAELAPLITQHLKECMFDRVGQEPQLSMLPLLSRGEFHGVGSRMKIMKEVMDSLQNDSIFVIGLFGMGGIGKTMLVKEIAEEVKKEKLFDEVAFVVVSHDKPVEAIQDQLASQLGLKSIANEIDIRRRAGLLHKRLMDEKKKILVILDDIWKEHELNSVGIPIHGDRDGFKILITSRFDSVCTDMKVQKRLEVGILADVEACILFNVTAEISAEISDKSILRRAKEIAQECAGLPLAIVRVAKSLRNKKEPAFRDVLRAFRDPIGSSSSRIHGVLHSCIKSSYDCLDSNDHRLLLLLCSLFPEDYDITIEDLVRYARGLIETFKTMAEVRDRVESIVDDLMKCYLLLQGEIRKCVKLHAVVRGVCISIASKSDDVHISLKFDDLNNVLSGMKSPRLRLLRMVNEEYFWKSAYQSGGLKLENTLNREMTISEEMQEVRVLEVNHITIRVPSSLQSMIKLQTLSLDYCRLQGDLSGIGSLKLLRVLSFFQSIVEMFPMEIAKLTNLQCLDLRFKLEHPSTLPLRTLSNLKELEELYLGNIVSLDIKSLKEVCLSSKLHTIQFVVKDDSCFEGLLRNLNLSKLIRFHIARDLEDGGEIEYQVRENVLELHQKNVHIDLNLLKELMRRVEWFYLNGHGLTNAVQVLGENGFQNLKELKLHDCDMKYLIDATDHLAQCDFSKLETLKINNARKLEELIYGDPPAGTLIGNFNVSGPFQSPLGNLRRLEIFQCGKVKSLFSKSMMNCLGRLEFVDIKFCPMFERIVRIQKVDEVDFSHGTEFPKLKHLTLNELPEFQSLGPGSDVVAGLNEAMLPKLEHLTIMLHDTRGTRGMKKEVGEVCSYLGSSLPKVRYMDIMKCNNLLAIAKSGLVYGFQDLQTLRVRMCSNVKVVFNFEEIMGQLSTETLGRLEELELSDLSKLRHIWTMLPPKGSLVFRNLKKIQVKECHILKHLLTPSITKMLEHLEEIKLQNNYLMFRIIGIDEIDMPHDGEKILPERLILPKLKSLTMERLVCLSELCSSPDLNLELPSITELQVIDCPFDLLTGETHALQNLRKIKFEKCGELEYLLTSSVQVLVHLEELVLRDNQSMYAIFKPQIKSNGDEVPNQSIVLPKLRILEISNLQNFTMLCQSSNLNLDLPSLFRLFVEDCPMMSKLCAGQLSAPLLTNVIYGSEEIDLATFIDSWLETKLQYRNSKRPMHRRRNSDEATDEYLYTAPSSLYASHASATGPSSTRNSRTRNQGSVAPSSTSLAPLPHISSSETLSSVASALAQLSRAPPSPSRTSFAPSSPPRTSLAPSSPPPTSLAPSSPPIAPYLPNYESFKLKFKYLRSSRIAEPN